MADVRRQDRELEAWQRHGRAVESGGVVAEPGDAVLTGDGPPSLTTEEAAALPAAGGLLLDARAVERQRGEVEPIDPRAGHVPRAVSAPTTQNLADDGTLLPVAALIERFAALGAEPGRTVGVYCG